MELAAMIRARAQERIARARGVRLQHARKLASAYRKQYHVNKRLTPKGIKNDSIKYLVYDRR